MWMHGEFETRNAKRALLPSALLIIAENPAGDILIDLTWITFWCALIALSTRLLPGSSPRTNPQAQ